MLVLDPSPLALSYLDSNNLPMSFAAFLSSYIVRLVFAMSSWKIKLFSSTSPILASYRGKYFALIRRIRKIFTPGFEPFIARNTEIMNETAHKHGWLTKLNIGPLLVDWVEISANGTGWPTLFSVSRFLD